MANHEASQPSKDLMEAYPQGIEDGWVELGDRAQPHAGEAIFARGADGVERPLVGSAVARHAQDVMARQTEIFSAQTRKRQDS